MSVLITRSLSKCATLDLTSACTVSSGCVVFKGRKKSMAWQEAINSIASTFSTFCSTRKIRHKIQVRQSQSLPLRVSNIFWRPIRPCWRGLLCQHWSGSSPRRQGAWVFCSRRPVPRRCSARSWSRCADHRAPLWRGRQADLTWVGSSYDLFGAENDTCQCRSSQSVKLRTSLILAASWMAIAR